MRNYGEWSVDRSPVLSTTLCRYFQLSLLSIVDKQSWFFAAWLVRVETTACAASRTHLRHHPKAKGVLTGTHLHITKDVRSWGLEISARRGNMQRRIDWEYCLYTLHVPVSYTECGLTVVAKIENVLLETLQYYLNGATDISSSCGAGNADKYY